MLNVAGRRQAPIPKVSCPLGRLGSAAAQSENSEPPLAGSSRIG